MAHKKKRSPLARGQKRKSTTLSERKSDLLVVKFCNQDKRIGVNASLMVRARKDMPERAFFHVPRA